MPVLPLVEREALERRLRFLKAFAEQDPWLDEDRDVFSEDARAHGLADTRMQLAELELATNRTQLARTRLRQVAEAAGAIAPLRALTAAVVVRGPIEPRLWADARTTVRNEPQVELYCGLELAAGGTDQAGEVAFRTEPADALSAAAPRARITRLKALFDPLRAPDDPYAAGASFVALHADYAARLSASLAARELASVPAPWSLIDWPLLAVHLAMRRTPPFLIPPPFLLEPPRPRGMAYVMMVFLDQLAAELDNGEGGTQGRPEISR